MFSQWLVWFGIAGVVFLIEWLARILRPLPVRVIEDDNEIDLLLSGPIPVYSFTHLPDFTGGSVTEEREDHLPDTELRVGFARLEEKVSHQGAELSRLASSLDGGFREMATAIKEQGQALNKSLDAFGEKYVTRDSFQQHVQNFNLLRNAIFLVIGLIVTAVVTSLLGGIIQS